MTRCTRAPEWYREVTVRPYPGPGGTTDEDTADAGTADGPPPATGLASVGYDAGRAVPHEERHRPRTELHPREAA
jgi:hypothetical protein